ncbi:hypothetical protein AQUCO_00300274v1 [Aquilegia coerulea]|uniref:Uncharacterized protein n=1 Tax=Aquilegia coerulea TaxID=218851 RepID=A0A2G5EXY8_AQUCA|nr:hypothetical protein AQUCO_00300274v1 [Aquilegia coerulea]
MASWVRSITSPFRKACTFFNQNQTKDNKQSQIGHDIDNRGMDLHGEVMACAYEDVQVMWSILDNSKTKLCKISS